MARDQTDEFDDQVVTLIKISREILEATRMTALCDHIQTLYGSVDELCEQVKTLSETMRECRDLLMEQIVYQARYETH